MSLWDKIWGGKIWGKKKKEKEEEKKEEIREIPVSLGSKYLFIPYISEKSLKLAREENVYTFLVDPKLNKNQIKQIIKSNFKVNPLSIRTINYPKRIRGVFRIKSKRPKFKKALIKLKEGESLPFFET